ncbi:MAG: hypothetical protein V4580_14115 [Bacteroidota bacterium]
MLVNDIILEIKNYSNTSVHKSALDIYKLLEGNKDVFMKKMQAADFEHLLTNFENLTYANPKDYQTPGYEREYRKQYDLLLFYLDRIV